MASFAMKNVEDEIDMQLVYSVVPPDQWNAYKNAQIMRILGATLKSIEYLCCHRRVGDEDITNIQVRARTNFQRINEVYVCEVHLDDHRRGSSIREFAQLFELYIGHIRTAPVYTRCVGCTTIARVAFQCVAEFANRQR